MPPRTFVQRIKNNLRLNRLQLKQLVFPACGLSSKSHSSQHGAQTLIFHQTLDAAPYPGPLIPSRGLTPCTWSHPHMGTTGPTLLPSSDLNGGEQRTSMRTVTSDVRRRPLYLGVQVFPKPCPWGGTPCIAYETSFNLRGYS